MSDSDSDEIQSMETDEPQSTSPSISKPQTPSIPLDDPSLVALINPKQDTLSYDLGNLTAYDDQSITFNSQASSCSSDLLTHTRHNVQLLINRIFTLPSEDIKGEPGRLAVLPTPVTPIPRAKPMPKPAAPTRWEAFAKLKGIQKRKKSSHVYDEVKDEWAPRHGYKRVKSEDEQNFVIEAKPGDDSKVDPWTKMDQEKKERVTKNKKQQANNLLKQAGGSRLPGTLDLSALAPPKEGKRNQQGKKKDKHHVDVALGVVQKSTASMGKFDAKRDAEPEMKAKVVRRDAELASVPNEKKQSLSVFSKMFSGSNAEDHVDSHKAVNFDQQQKEKDKRVRPSSKKKTPKYGPRKGKGGDDD